jgi:hypothetical protein
MNKELKLLAENVTAWSAYYYCAAWVKTPLGKFSSMWSTDDFIAGHTSYTKKQWQAARIELGLDSPFTSPEEDEAWADAERRMDTIGQNGNTAEHYDAPPLKLHSEEEKMQKIISDLKAAEHYKEPPVREKYGAYQKDVRHLDTIDVYETHRLFNVEDPSGCIQHASKKLLLSGVRTGGKTKLQDIEEARDTLNRWLEMERRT